MNRRRQWLAVALMLLAGAFVTAGCGHGGTPGDPPAGPGQSNSVSFSPPTLPSRTRTPRPTTAPPTVQPTTSSAAAPTPAHSSHATASPSAASGTASSLLWLWILLGVALIVVAAVLIARRSGRRAALASGWHTRLADACAKGSALYDAMSMAEAPGAPSASEAGARWVDIQRRADDLAQTLYALRQAAPSDIERARVADVITSLQSVRAAADAEHGPGGAEVPRERVRARLHYFGTSLRALCSPDSPGRG